jgi:hypothetical protein
LACAFVSRSSSSTSRRTSSAPRRLGSSPIAGSGTACTLPPSLRASARRAATAGLWFQQNDSPTRADIPHGSPQRVSAAQPLVPFVLNSFTPAQLSASMDGHKCG